MTKAFVKALNDKNLIHSTETLVKKERSIVECLIWHLEEIQARKLFISMGYASLFECLIKHFKYSETTAYGRLSVLKIIKDVPTVGEALNSGELNITNLTLAQSFIKKQEKENGEKLSLEEKSVLISCLKNKSTQEVKQLFARINPASALPVDQVKYLNDTQVQIQATVNKALLEKISYLKSLISHEHINPTYEVLLNLAFDAAIEKVEKKKGIYNKPIIDRKSSQETTEPPEEVLQTVEQEKSSPTLAPKNTAKLNKQRSVNGAFIRGEPNPTTQSFVVGTSRYISSSVKKFILNRADHQCEHIHNSGERCTSKFQLQFDHIKAFSKGGNSSYSNIQVLCRVHNNYKSNS